ncbi:VOC family protein [Oceanobacillus piezotolerans]|uniref:VOC family protein n=1 Tax=Oceanobacillus piezotolerans TaxID=2448030 RepID=A0A498DAA4_9BACI|nr:VOC family protein [Oceanobacillus piezotolerans]RLL48263.1 VOC family protein [Oceanobacillus piezotolerans]
MIEKEVGALFIPVSNIEKARDWYCDLLGIEPEGEIVHGHLYVIPMKNPQIVLDSKIYDPESIYKVPAFHFNSKNIEESYLEMKKKGIELTTDIQFGHYFNFKDSDGNHLMVCAC